MAASLVPCLCPNSAPSRGAWLFASAALTQPATFRQLPCRGAESEHGDQEAVPVVDYVAHLRPSHDLVAESVGACILQIFTVCCI